MSSGKGTRRADESSPAAVSATEPFFFAGGDTGCLLVHGLTSSPNEMRFLGDRLHAAGYTVLGVQLAGHGSIPDDLARCSRWDWYRSVEAGLGELRGRCGTVVAVGLSLGGLLALRLAHERRDDVRALVLLAPALELSRWWVPWLAPGLRVLSPFLPRDWRYFPKPASDIADPTAREAHLSYGKVPLTTVSELALLQAETREMLRRVAQPTLAIQGRHDHTVPLRTLALLQQELPNLWAAAILPSSYHVITVDVEKDRVAEEVLRFLGQALQGRPRPRGRRMRP